MAAMMIIPLRPSAIFLSSDFVPESVSQSRLPFAVARDKTGPRGLVKNLDTSPNQEAKAQPAHGPHLSGLLRSPTIPPPNSPIVMASIHFSSLTKSKLLKSRSTQWPQLRRNYRTSQ